MKKAAITIGVLVLFGAMAIPFLFGPSDEQMIKDALKESIKASREGRPGGVMPYLSRLLKYNDQDVEDRMSVANYIKSARPEVTVTNPQPVINGDTATIISPVDLTFALGVGNYEVPIHLDRAEITFAKETGTRFLIFPAPTWRIRDIKAEEIDLSQLQK